MYMHAVKDHAQPPLPLPFLKMYLYYNIQQLPIHFTTRKNLGRGKRAPEELGRGKPDVCSIPTIDAVAKLSAHHLRHDTVPAV